MLFNTRLTAISQPPDGEIVTLTRQTASGETTTTTSTYGGSRRRPQYNPPPPLYPLPRLEQLVSTNIIFDFGAHGWLDGNFMLEPDRSAVVGWINNENLWCLSYGEKEGLGHEEIRAGMDWKFFSMFPGEKSVKDIGWSR